MQFQYGGSSFSQSLHGRVAGGTLHPISNIKGVRSMSIITLENTYTFNLYHNLPRIGAMLGEMCGLHGSLRVGYNGDGNGG